LGASLQNPSLLTMLLTISLPPSSGPVSPSQIRDVLDMKKNKWVPRRETFTAKKLDEVHAEAEAELGIVSSSKIAADLPALPGGLAAHSLPHLHDQTGARMEEAAVSGVDGGPAGTADRCQHLANPLLAHLSYGRMCRSPATSGITLST
jgi:hypothetical protein